MRFHLVYTGSLGSSGNSSPKPGGVLAIRRHLSPQLEHLWRTHNALQVLLRTGARKLSDGVFAGFNLSPREMAAKFPQAYHDLVPAIAVGSKAYTPLVRKSLDLACELKILFLRQQDPGQLISQGGDIDNRIKTLLDALRMPSKAEQDQYPPTEDALYCLLESDHLVSRLDVDTDRLLFAETTKHDEVHLVIEVSLNVLQVHQHNMCLL